MSRPRVAVVGVGHLGRHHARILAGLPEVELIGVVDARIDQARAVAESCGAKAYASTAEILDKVDAVSIAVPTSLHREVAAPFLDRGLPTLIEKPLAASLEEAEYLANLAESRGAPLQVGHIERFNPALSALSSMRSRPKFVSAERLGVYTFRSADVGVVLDLMIHDIDLLLSLVDAEVRSVSAVGISLFGGHEDVAEARIEFADGCVANLSASRASFQAVRKMRVWTDEGYVSLDFSRKHGTVIRPSDALRRGVLDLDGLDLSKVDDVRDRMFGKIFRVDQVPPATGPDQLTMELSDFAKVVSTGSRPRVSGADALRAMRLADQVLASLRSHSWDEIGSSASARIPSEPAVEATSAIPAPKSWKYRNIRQERGGFVES